MLTGLVAAVNSSSSAWRIGCSSRAGPGSSSADSSSATLFLLTLLLLALLLLTLLLFALLLQALHTLSTTPYSMLHLAYALLTSAKVW